MKPREQTAEAGVGARTTRDGEGEGTGRRTWWPRQTTMGWSIDGVVDVRGGSRHGRAHRPPPAVSHRLTTTTSDRDPSADCPYAHQTCR